jgi:hypothetical protein
MVFVCHVEDVIKLFESNSKHRKQKRTIFSIVLIIFQNQFFQNGRSSAGSAISGAETVAALL